MSTDTIAVITFPSGMQMAKRLATVVGKPYMIPGLAEQLVESLADLQLSTARTAVLAVRVVLDKYARSFPNKLSAAQVGPLSKALVKHFVDDEQLRMAALRQPIETANGNGLGFSNPGDEALWYSEWEEAQLVDGKQHMRLVKLIGQAYRQEMLVSVDPDRMAPPAPKHRTLNGLFMECDADGSPTTLWTPWGSWRFAVCSDATDEHLRNFVARFKLGYYLPGELINGKDQGAVFGIVRFDGEPLPTPIAEPGDLDDLEAYQHDLEAWAELYDSCVR